MKDYKLTKMYMLISPHTNLVYVGHTTQDLSKRHYEHKQKSNKCNSKQIIDFGDSKIILICKYPCNDAEEARQEEQRHIDLNKENCVNCMRAYNSIEYNKECQKQYYIENADKFKEQAKQYNIENADKIKEYHNQYKIENADKIKQYNIENADNIKEYHKQYRLENADKIKQYNIENADKIKQYNIENADKIKERKKQYRLKNADKQKEYHKQYRLENADKIKENQRKRYAEKKAEQLTNI